MIDVEFELTKTYNISYDATSKEFQDSFKTYKEVIDKRAGINDMLKQVIWHVDKFGADGMIEGVGYVAEDGKKKGKPYCGINFMDLEPEATVEKIFTY